MIKIVLLSALIGLAVSESYHYVTEVEYGGENAQELADKNEASWVSENEIVVKCYAGDKHPGQRGSHEDADHGLNVFTNAFNAIGGNISHVSTRGKELWVVKKDNTIHRYHGNKWHRMPGAAVNVGASADGWTWVVNAQDMVFRFNPNKQDWERMPGALVQVSALSKDEAIGVNRQKTVFLWKDGAWVAQPRSAAKGLGNGAIWASLGKDDERWAIGPYKGIWRWNHQAGKWVAQPGAADTVDVFSPGRIVVTNKLNRAFTWLPANKRWQHLAGKVARRAAIGDNILLTLDVQGFLSALAF